MIEASDAGRFEHCAGHATHFRYRLSEKCQRSVEIQHLVARKLDVMIRKALIESPDFVVHVREAFGGAEPARQFGDSIRQL
jgi:hypothetical protein